MMGNWRDKYFKYVNWDEDIDKPILRAVKAMNRIPNIITSNSCSGHNTKYYFDWNGYILFVNTVPNTIPTWFSKVSKSVQLRCSRRNLLYGYVEFKYWGQRKKEAYDEPIGDRWSLIIDSRSDTNCFNKNHYKILDVLGEVLEEIAKNNGSNIKEMGRG